MNVATIARIGWLTHRPHHGGSSFNLTLALRQSSYPLAGIALLPIVALTGVPFETAAVVVAVSNTWQAVIHTQARAPLPAWLERTVMTPATHEIHHDHGGSVNLGPVPHPPGPGRWDLPHSETASEPGCDARS